MNTFVWRQSFFVSVRIFLISRIIIFSIWAGAGCLNVLAQPVGATFRDSIIELNSNCLVESFRKLAKYNDAGWYYDIAVNGYDERPFDTTRAANWAFFPLHPIIWRFAIFLGFDCAFAGIFLANLFFLIALILVHRVTVELGYGFLAANGAVLFLGFCPVSYFFSLPWSESLFLLLTTSTFLAAIKKRWELVFLFGAGACACRFVGLFLLPSLILWLWPQRNHLPIKAWLAVAAIPGGLLAFMFVLWTVCGDPAAFMDIQQVWGRHFTIPYKAFGVVIIKPYFWASDWNLRPLNFTAFVVGGLACYWLAKRKGQMGLAIYLGLGLLAPAMTGSLTSMARYSVGLFPLAIAAGYFLQRREIERVFLVISVALLAIMVLAFQYQFSFAGA